MNVSMAIVIVALVFGTPGLPCHSVQESQPVTTCLAKHVGDNVRVTDAAGTTLTGTLWEVRAEEISVMTGAVAQTVKFVRITAVHGADSVRDGFIKGALFGVAHGILAYSMDDREYGPGLIAGAVIVDALIGGIIDSLHTDWTPLYVREQKRSKTSAGSPRAAITLRVRF
jgi:hypothetical protein